METNTFDADQEARPQFLSVLCILTFIGVGILLAYYAYSIHDTFLLTPDERAAMHEERYQQYAKWDPEGADAMMEQMSKGEKYEIPTWITGVACNLLTLFGAILMWRPKKIGFYFYLAGEILPYLVPFILGMIHNESGSFSSMGGKSQGFAIAMGVIVVLSDIAFIVMYALNLKHMKK